MQAHIDQDVEKFIIERIKKDPEIMALQKYKIDLILRQPMSGIIRNGCFEQSQLERLKPVFAKIDELIELRTKQLSTICTHIG